MLVVRVNYMYNIIQHTIVLPKAIYTKTMYRKKAVFISKFVQGSCLKRRERERERERERGKGGKGGSFLTDTLGHIYVHMYIAKHIYSTHEQLHLDNWLTVHVHVQCHVACTSILRLIVH